jgi:hypothetical protein
LRGAGVKQRSEAQRGCGLSGGNRARTIIRSALNRHQWDDASGRNAGDETRNKSARNFKAAKKNMPARTGDADAEPGTTVL